MKPLENQRVAVVGASRGLGRGVAEALGAAGASVLAVARNREALSTLAADVRVGDATDPVFVQHTLADEELDTLVLVAGARPAMTPIGDYDWEAFRRPFEVDVKATFHWLQGALRSAPKPSRVVVFSSGAALHGSPLSGGYAGAKHTQRFLCRYAQQEARERELDLTIRCVLPQLNPNTALGAAGVRAYAAKAGETVDAFVQKRFGDRPLSPTIAGEAIRDLLADDAFGEGPEHLLTGAGLRSLP